MSSPKQLLASGRAGRQFRQQKAAAYQTRSASANAGRADDFNPTEPFFDNIDAVKRLAVYRRHRCGRLSSGASVSPTRPSLPRRSASADPNFTTTLRSRWGLRDGPPEASPPSPPLNEEPLSPQASDVPVHSTDVRAHDVSTDVAESPAFAERIANAPTLADFQSAALHVLQQSRRAPADADSPSERALSEVAAALADLFTAVVSSRHDVTRESEGHSTTKGETVMSMSLAAVAVHIQGATKRLQNVSAERSAAISTARNAVAALERMHKRARSKTRTAKTLAKAQSDADRDAAIDEQARRIDVALSTAGSDEQLSPVEALERSLPDHPLTLATRAAPISVPGINLQASTQSHSPNVPLSARSNALVSARSDGSVAEAADALLQLERDISANAEKVALRVADELRIQTQAQAAEIERLTMRNQQLMVLARVAPKHPEPRLGVAMREREAAERAAQEALEELEAAQRQIEDRDRVITDLQNTLDELAAERDTLQVEQETARGQHDEDADAAIRSLEAEVDRLTVERDELNQALEQRDGDAAAAFAALQAELDAAVAELDSAQTRAETMVASAVEDAQRSVEDLQAQLDEACRERDAASEGTVHREAVTRLIHIAADALGSPNAVSPTRPDESLVEIATRLVLALRAALQAAQQEQERVRAAAVDERQPTVRHESGAAARMPPLPTEDSAEDMMALGGDVASSVEDYRRTIKMLEEERATLAAALEQQQQAASRDVAAALQSLQRDLDDAVAERDAATAAMDRIADDKDADVGAALSALQAELDLVVTERDRLQEELMATQNSDARAQLEALRREHDELRAAWEAHTSNSDDAAAAIQSLTEELDQSTTERDAVQALLEQRNNAEDSAAAIASLQADLDEAIADRDRIAEELQATKARARTDEGADDDAQIAQQVLQAQLVAARAGECRLSEMVRELQSQLDNVSRHKKANGATEGAAQKLTLCSPPPADVLVSVRTLLERVFARLPNNHTAQTTVVDVAHASIAGGLQRLPEATKYLVAAGIFTPQGTGPTRLVTVCSGKGAPAAAVLAAVLCDKPPGAFLPLVGVHDEKAPQAVQAAIARGVVARRGAPPALAVAATATQSEVAATLLYSTVAHPIAPFAVVTRETRDALRAAGLPGVAHDAFLELNDDVAVVQLPPHGSAALVQLAITALMSPNAWEDGPRDRGLVAAYATQDTVADLLAALGGRDAAAAVDAAIAKGLVVERNVSAVPHHSTVPAFAKHSTRTRTAASAAALLLAAARGAADHDALGDGVIPDVGRQPPARHHHDASPTHFDQSSSFFGRIRDCLAASHRSAVKLRDVMRRGLFEDAAASALPHHDRAALMDDVAHAIDALLHGAERAGALHTLECSPARAVRHSQPASPNGAHNASRDRSQPARSLARTISVDPSDI
jgi:hypothetical protein